MREKKKRNPIGRPPRIDDDRIRKLEYAFALGCTDKEACLYANIALSTFYKWLADRPETRERFNTLKETPVFKARQTVLKSIENGDDVSARWYLERKRSDEFRTGHDVAVTADSHLTIEERSKALGDFLSRFAADP